MNPETRTCQNCKQTFLIESDDFAFYERIKVPPPTWCPECRMIRRFSFRHEKGLYRVKDAASGKEIFSGISPQSGLKVYGHDYWWSDAWDASEYAQDIDFSRPFLGQVRELMYKVPWPSRGIIDLVNSDYSDKASYLKNCYLCFNSGQIEDSAYITSSWYIKNSFDITEGEKVELCYQCQETGESYKTFFSLYCDQANGVWFSRDCTGCTDCFGCVNLRNKQYYIFNEQYSKEEYLAKLKEFDTGSYENFRRIFEMARKRWMSHPYKYSHGTHNLNVSGDCLHNSKNAFFSYQIDDVENSKFLQNVNFNVRDSYDYTTWGENAELMYEAIETGLNCRNVRFSFDSWPAMQDSEYSIKCGSSSNLFGCVGLKKKSYCILNKQYTPEEFYALREKIMKHMEEMPYVDSKGRVYKYGEFFPLEFSPYSYYETIAQDYFPLTSEEAKEKGFKWISPEVRNIPITKQVEELPDHINHTDRSILNEVIACSSCNKPYRIIASELQFLKINTIPLPRICWECRHHERLSWTNSPRYFSGNCSCSGSVNKAGNYTNQAEHSHGQAPCSNEFITTFAPDRKEIVYCEPCYQAEII